MRDQQGQTRRNPPLFVALGRGEGLPAAALLFRPLHVERPRLAPARLAAAARLAAREELTTRLLVSEILALGDELPGALADVASRQTTPARRRLFEELAAAALRWRCL